MSPLRTLLLLASSVWIAEMATAATITVTSSADSGPGTLRNALAQSSLTPGPHRIEFNMGGSTLITLSSPLPTIVRTTSIDGYSQPGTSPNTATAPFENNAQEVLILFDADGAIRIQADAVLRGLRFVTTGDSLVVESGRATIRGCAFDSPARAIVGQGGTLLVGGPTPADRVSINGGTNGLGIDLDAATGASSFDNLHLRGRQGMLSRQRITLRRSAIDTAELSVVLTGAGDASSLTEIRFEAPADRRGGIVLQGVDDVEVGSAAGPNVFVSSRGVRVAANGQRNHVAFNQGEFLDGPLIELDPIGLNANDPLDADEGNNAGQNHPLLTSARRANENEPVQVIGTLHSLPQQTFRITFYANVGNRLSLSPVTTTVVTDSAGDATIGPIGLPLASGATAVAASATRLDGSDATDTSELGPAIPIDAVAPGEFIVSSLADSGIGSLRSAVVAANATPNGAVPDRIRFSVAGSIELQSKLPDITDPVTIDGYSAPDASPNTDVLSDSNAVLTIVVRGRPGIGPWTFRAPNVTVRGLAFVEFESAIELSKAPTERLNRIEGCWFGIARNLPIAITRSSIVMERSETGPGHIIGGSDPASRNVFAGSAGVAVAIAETEVINNLFGIDPISDLPIEGGNRLSTNVDRVRIVGNVIGGSTASAGGLPEEAAGLLLQGRDLDILDNAIGFGVEGSSLPIPNRFGIVIAGAENLRIESASRLIGGTEVGVSVLSARGLTLRQAVRAGASAVVMASPSALAPIENVSVEAPLFSDDLGAPLIDLGGDGASPNDPLDADSGPNGLQNHPVITGLTRRGLNFDVDGALNSAPNTSFEITICRARPAASRGRTCDALASPFVVVTDGTGFARISESLLLPSGTVAISAIAARLTPGAQPGDPPLRESSEVSPLFPELVFANGFE